MIDTQLAALKKSIIFYQIAFNKHSQVCYLALFLKATPGIKKESIQRYSDYSSKQEKYKGSVYFKIPHDIWQFLI